MILISYVSNMDILIILIGDFVLLYCCWTWTYAIVYCFFIVVFVFFINSIGFYNMEKYIFSPRASTQPSATPNAQKSTDLSPNPTPIPNPKSTSEIKVPTPRSPLKQFIDLEGDNTWGTSSKRKPVRKSPA